jgi:translation initiation factor 2 alpha subunit (eIF-2alpha)
MSLSAAAVVEASARRLFPNLSLDQVMVELLLERAQKNLIKYQAMARHFEAKYGQDFKTFRQAILCSEPTLEVEQDYFDWELAVTGVSDMKEEIERLRALSEPA